MDIDIYRSVSFSGYRKQKLMRSICEEGSLESVERALGEEIEALYQRGYNTFITGGADGFDLMATVAVARLKSLHEDVKLVVAIPFEGYDKDFDECDREHYASLIEGADLVEVVSPHYHQRVYLARNDYMLRNSSVLLCYYDGVKGGTMYTFNRAKRSCKEVINLAASAPEVEVEPTLF
ncbi:MAG: SLOG family protein [Rikenellaceae bacterium]